MTREIIGERPERDASALLFQAGLTSDDRAWLRAQFELAGLPTPEVDVSWLHLEPAEPEHWAWPVVLVAVLGALSLVVLAVLQVAGMVS